MRNYVEEVLFLTGAHGREGERGLIKKFGAEPELEAFCYGKGHHSRLKEVANSPLYICRQRKEKQTMMTGFRYFGKRFGEFRV